MVEHLFEAQGVGGSIPSLGTSLCPISKMDDYTVLRTQGWRFNSFMGYQIPDAVQVKAQQSYPKDHIPTKV